MQVTPEPLINDSRKVLPRFTLSRCLPVSVGRSSPAGQAVGPGLRVGVALAVGLGVLEVVALGFRSAVAVAVAVGVAIGETLSVGAEVALGEVAAGAGAADCGDPLLVPLAIRATTTASTKIAAPRTATRRAQYVGAGSGPTGWSTLLITAEPKQPGPQFPAGTPHRSVPWRP